MNITTNDSEQSKTTHTANNARAIIINIDDLGLSSAVNEAVIHLAERGHVGASSYMVGGSITAGEIQKLAALNVDIGLHLDLTGIFPSALQGSLKSIIVASYLRRLNSAQVTEVIKSQLDAFEDQFGHAPVFIDGHQHIHQFPIIRQCLMNELNTRYSNEISKGAISARVTTPLINDFKSWIIYVLGGHTWRKLCNYNHITTNDKFGGVYDFEANGQELAALWEQWLQNAPRTTELAPALLTTNSVPLPLPTLIMCHPAVADDSWQDEIKLAREREYEWLMSNEFAGLLQKYDVRLRRWSEPL